MPKVKANKLTFNYEQQGSGEPLILIPFLTAENACYAFQVADYAKHFTCISIDLRGTGESDKVNEAYTTEDLADDVAAVMQALNISSAHITGLSLGAGVGLCFGVRYPEKVKSLSVHSGWTRTDLFLETVIKSWQVSARALNSIQELAIQNIFPWCFTPNLYAKKPDYVQSLADFIKTRPTMSIDDFILQSNAVLAHNVEEQLGSITAPTQITFGAYDMITSTRFARPMQDRIRNHELVIFEECSHAALYENVEEFNQRTLAFLQRNSSIAAAG